MRQRGAAAWPAPKAAAQTRNAAQDGFGTLPRHYFSRESEAGKPRTSGGPWFRLHGRSGVQTARQVQSNLAGRPRNLLGNAAPGGSLPQSPGIHIDARAARRLRWSRIQVRAMTAEKRTVL